MHDMFFQVLHVKIGAPVIITKNITDTIVNGQIGTVLGISNQKIVVQLKNTTVDVTPTTFRE